MQTRITGGTTNNSTTVKKNNQTELPIFGKSGEIISALNPKMIAKIIDAWRFFVQSKILFL